MLSTFDYSWTTKAATQPVGIKRRDDKEKRYGSHMAGWGRALAPARGSRARRRGLRGHQGEESTRLSLSSILPSSSEPSVCQDKQMRRHMLERLLENYWGSFSSRTRWKEVCNPVVFTPPHTVTASSLCIPSLGTGELQKCTNYLKMCDRILLFSSEEGFIMNDALRLHYQMKSVIPALLNSNSLMLIHNDLSHREKNKLMKS